MTTETKLNLQKVYALMDDIQWEFEAIGYVKSHGGTQNITISTVNSLIARLINLREDLESANMPCTL